MAVVLIGHLSAIAATHHVGVAGVFGHVNMFPVGSYLLLSLFPIFSLFSGTGFLFGHFWFSAELDTDSVTCKHGQTGWTTPGGNWATSSAWNSAKNEQLLADISSQCFSNKLHRDYSQQHGWWITTTSTTTIKSFWHFCSCWLAAPVSADWAGVS